MTNNALDDGRTATVGEKLQRAHVAIFALVCALIVGVYIWSANSGMIELLGSNAKHTYYNLLVEGLFSGQLSLDAAVPPSLEQLPDPYNPMANDPYRMVYGHPMHDLSYYKGKLYLYFGITPALLLFWPYTALTGGYLLHRDAVVIFFSAGFLTGAGLLLSLWRRYGEGVGFWTIMSCIIALGLANFAPVSLERCEVYEVAISCGYAMTMLALAALWRAWHDPERPWQWLAGASLAYGLAIGARPSLLVGAIILVAPVVKAWRDRQPWLRLLMAAVIPIALIGLGLMFYNALRFDNPWEFGQRYQLSSYRQDTMKQFNLRYLWFNFRLCFLEPARWSGTFPFVHDIAVPSLPKGAGQPEHPFGILTNIPMVWLALAAPLVWRGRPFPSRSTLRWFVGVVTLLFGICALTLGLYFTMCLRYEIEFTHLLVLLGVVGIIGLERSLARRRGWLLAARCGWGLLLAFSVVFNLLAGFGLRAEACNIPGLIAFQKGDLTEAIACYQKALQWNPENADTHSDLGLAFLREHRLDAADAQFQQALRLNSADPSVHINLGTVLAQEGKSEEAISQFRDSLQIQPYSFQAQNDLAYLLATCPQASLRNGSQAVILATKAATLTRGQNPVILRTLAAALAESGRFSEAVQIAQNALKMAQAHGDTQFAAELRLEMNLYQAGRPYRDSASSH
jgi:Flp pilus assembly protein TadD